MRYDGRGGFRRGGFGRSRFGGRGGGFDLPKPIKVGEEYDAEITEEGSKGDGIARIKNFVVFVAGAKKGEKIRIKITDVRNRFAIAEKIGAASESEAVEATETTEATEAPTEAAETAEDVGEAEAAEPEVEVESKVEAVETPEAEAAEEG